MTSHPRKQESWRLIDSQADLVSLDDCINWDDAEAVALVGQRDVGNSLLPLDVARSGYINWNLRVLFFVAHGSGSHLELMLVDCDETGPGLFAGFTLNGRVDKLKRVEILNPSGQRQLRCSRLMYRFIELDHEQGRRFYGFGDGMIKGGAG
jgi:hypothetical protein